jgi:TPP-dependent trihydroxycyclohexane-1,2-dione (THcHDO) dehydratase
MSRTIRLTAAQALVRYLAALRAEWLFVDLCRHLSQ